MRPGQSCLIPLVSLRVRTSVVINRQDFDRIIIDTAPTGHTLRLLGFPEFLDNFLEKVDQHSFAPDRSAIFLCRKYSKRLSIFGIERHAAGVE